MTATPSVHPLAIFGVRTQATIDSRAVLLPSSTSLRGIVILEPEDSDPLSTQPSLL